MTMASSVACLRAFSLRIDSSLNELHPAVASSVVPPAL
jgi:hypothetical protein